MEVIYVDTLFLINLIVNYFILLATARICALPLKRLRLALAAAAGGAYAVMSVVPILGDLTGAPLKLIFAVIMLLIAFGPVKRFLRAAIVFLAVSAAFGGAVYAVSLLGGGTAAGGLFVPVSPRILALSFAVSYVAVTLVFWRQAKRTERTISDIELRVGTQTVALKALHDTGNSLSDPLTGQSVIVAEMQSILSLFSKNTADCIASIRETPSAEVFERVSEIGGERMFRLLPYSSVGVEMGLLLAFRPDNVKVGGHDHSSLVVAISPTAVSEDGTYTALIGGDL